MNELAEVLVSVTMVRPEERLLLRALRAIGLTARSVTPRHTAAILNNAAPQLTRLVRLLGGSNGQEVGRGQGQQQQ